MLGHLVRQFTGELRGLPLANELLIHRHLFQDVEGLEEAGVDCFLQGGLVKGRGMV